MKETRTDTSYLLWLGCFFQIHGLHRIYNGKIGTGLLWMCTFGFLWVGQIIDLCLIPSMVDEHNLKVRNKLGLSPNGVPLNPNSVNPTVVIDTKARRVPNLERETPKPLTQEQLMIKLAKAASHRGGRLSVTQAVIDTGVNFADVESALSEMLKKGYVGIDNHPESGVVVYHFLEL